MLARGGSLVTCVVNRNGQDVVVSIRNTSTLQRARCWRAVTVKLNSTASVVILRLGDNFERPVGNIGSDGAFERPFAGALQRAPMA